MAIYQGKLSDGRSARAVSVEVRLERALEFREQGAADGEWARWAFHRLETAVPLSRRSPDVLLRSKDHPGETLFVTAPGFAGELLARASQLSAGAERWRYAKPGIALAGLLALIVAAVFLLDLSPAKAIARLLPDAIREQIGEQAAASLAGGNRTCDDPAGIGALETMVAELSAASGSSRPFHVRVVEWDLVNAFAVPGERVVVSSGLIAKAQSADEVAGVIAHEMGHGIELHPEAGIVRAVGIAAGMELVFSGSSGTLSNLGALLLQLRYTRHAEQEADQHALRILREAAISPKPLSLFFERISKDDGGSADAAGSLFATHPPSPERARLAAEAATYEARPALQPAQWKALQSICGQG